MHNLTKIEHIGIAVSDLEKGIKMYTQILGVSPYKQEEVKSEKVMTVFFKVGASKIELLAATSPDSVIAKYITKKGEGMHHIAYAVNDIDASIKEMKKAGFRMIHDKPKEGADNKIIAFMHPKSTGGTLIELCMDK